MLKSFQPDIEGLRGVAILLVVFYHVGLPGFSGGYVGVDVFFVLSGYLITRLLVKEIEENGRLRLANFYARRARRLLPAAALTLLVTVIASYWLLAPVEQRTIPKSAFATAVYTSNIYFARAATDYLARGADTNPFLHTWSLSVEEQFYLLWPLLVLLALRFGRRGLIVTMIATFISTLGLCLWMTHARQPWAFFLSFSRAWEFAAGAISTVLARGTRFTQSVRWAGLAATVCAAALLTRQTAFPGIAALLPVAGTAIILHAGDASRGAGRLLAVPPLRFIGRISYSWYLWHWPTLVIATSLLGRLPARWKGACLLFSLSLAWVTYHTVENPIRNSRTLTWRPLGSLAMAACLIFLGATAVIGWRAAIMRAIASPQQARLVRASEDRPEIYGDGCFAGFYETAPHPCTYGEGKTVVLWGDSHAAQWFPALRALKGWRVVSLLKSACTAADVNYYYPTLGRRYTECEEWRTKALETIVNLHPEAVVVVSSKAYVPGLVTGAEWQAGNQRTLSKLVSLGARVYLIRDTPTPQFHIPTCLSRQTWNWRLAGSGCGFDRETGQNRAAQRTEEQAASKAGARYIDLTEFVCPKARCEPETDGQVIYDDESYLTATFTRRLSSIFEAILNEGSLPRQ